MNRTVLIVTLIVIFGAILSFVTSRIVRFKPSTLGQQVQPRVLLPGENIVGEKIIDESDSERQGIPPIPAKPFMDSGREKPVIIEQKIVQEPFLPGEPEERKEMVGPTVTPVLIPSTAEEKMIELSGPPKSFSTPGAPQDFYDKIEKAREVFLTPPPDQNKGVGITPNMDGTVAGKTPDFMSPASYNYKYRTMSTPGPPPDESSKAKLPPFDTITGKTPTEKYYR